MTQPTPAEQLLNLADRAERGPLTGPEAARLRTGIAVLYARVETLEHVAKGNKRHVQIIVQELETADAARLALRQRAERAEAAIERARAFADDIDTPTWRAPGTEVAARIHAALDEHQEQT